MKKILSMLCVVLVVGFACTAFAEPTGKVDVCHNGSVYIGQTNEPYNPEMWVPGSFVISISEKAVDKHVDNHGDFTNFTEGDEVITEVSVTESIITGHETQLSCEALQ